MYWGTGSRDLRNLSWKDSIPFLAFVVLSIVEKVIDLAALIE